MERMAFCNIGRKKKLIVAYDLGTGSHIQYKQFQVIKPGHANPWYGL